MIGTVRQHLVQAIRGTGLLLDGVVIDSSPNGPWSWPVPPGVCVIEDAMLIAGGGSGTPGGNPASGSSVGGGAGGAAHWLIGGRLPVLPGESLTLTVGAGGAAPTAYGAGGSLGGATTVVRPGGAQGIVAKALTSSVTVANVPASVGLAATGTAAAGGTAGNGTGAVNGGHSSSTFSVNGGTHFWHAGLNGGAGSATASVAGIWTYGCDSTLVRAWGLVYLTPSQGNTTGSLSRGAGGEGAPSPFGRGGRGGDGGAAAGAPAAGTWGAGGGGAGGGNNSPTAGMHGYIEFRYWRADV